MRRIVLLLLALTASLLSLSAQSVLSGLVVDKEGQPVEGANVRLLKGDPPSMVAFAVTDAEGHFRLKYHLPEGTKALLSITHISYSKEELPLDPKATDIRITVVPSTTELREVVVQSAEITERGDTLSYRLGAFTSEGDYMLGDALKRLPGVTVGKSGRIKYLGKDISKFYIEGLDLLGGRYNIATKNIPASYVSSVEVLTHHKEFKMDRDLYSDAVALNIRLSQRAKLKPVGTYEAAAGVGQSLLYQVSAAAMLFKPDFQTIGTAKSGNVEEFALHDSEELYDPDKVSPRAASVLGELSGSTPPIGRRRFITPIDHLVSFSSVSKLTEDRRVNASFGYSYTGTRYNEDYRLDFTHPSGEPTVIDRQTALKARTQAPFLRLEYSDNADDHYLTNRFKLESRFLHSTRPTQDSRSGTQLQREDYRYVTLVDRLRYSRRHGAVRWRTEVMAGYSTMPQGEVTITKGRGEEGEGQPQLLQTADSRQLLGEALLSGSYQVRRSTIRLPLTLRYDREELTTALTQIGDATPQTNLLRGDRVRLYLTPEYRLTHPQQKYSLSASVGISGVWYDYTNDGTVRTDLRKGFLRISPSLDLSYALDPRSTIRLKGSYADGLGSVTDLLTAPIRTGLVAQQTGPGVLAETQLSSVRGEYHFKDPLRMLFINGDVSYNHTRGNLTPVQSTSDELIGLSYLREPVTTDRTSLYGTITKQFRDIRTKVSISGGYSHSTTSMVQDEVTYHYTGDNVSLSPSIETKPWSFLELKYDYDFGLYATQTEGLDGTLTSHSHFIRMDLYPVKGLSFRLSSDITRREIAPDHFKTMTFLDARATYTHKKLRYTLSLNNLLNQQSYHYTLFDAINTYSYSYALRGRELLFSVTLTM